MLIDNVSTWPADVLGFVQENEKLFDEWDGPGSEQQVRDSIEGREPKPRKHSGKEYDRAHDGLLRCLSRHTLEGGYHCTRLTNTEIDSILRTGMQLQNGQTLGARLSALVAAGYLDKAAARKFEVENQADDDNRAGMLWFCFYMPGKAEESGIGRLLRNWGGEALYNSHEDHDGRIGILRSIGTPCLVVADVPINSMKNTWLVRYVARHYFMSRGFEIRECVDHENYATEAIPASAIRRIVKFPDPEFLRLTGCEEWRHKLTVDQTRV